ncbi:MAG: hypothetical protein KF830_18500 [Planctomycetes bacterium]|nr:hypothetical protein [Planctomycetota bacterium]
MIRSAALVCTLLVAAATAQTTATVPNLPSAQNVDRPFPGGIGRYQQWFSAASLQAFLPEPMRLQQIEFFAGSSLTANAALIDCEILLAHGLGSGLTGTFDTNYASPPVVVAPRQNRQLNAGAPGAVVMTIPFTTLFTWDRQRPLLLEIRVHGNSLGNQPFQYNFRGATTALGLTSRVYQAGSPGATSGLTQQGVGMVARFTARPGAVVDFGAGCVGGGGVAPRNVVVQVPSPGIVWQHQLTQAASQEICLWVIGDDRTQVDGVPLPLDFTQLLGYPPSGCLLRTNILSSGFYITVGGGPGQGFASFDWQLPGVSSYVGFSFFTQWFVLDPLSPNGVLTATQGVHSIVAPIGG